MTQKISIFIKIEIIIMLISIITLIFMAVPIYFNSFIIDYKSPIGIILTFLSAIGFLGIIVFLINSITLKFRFWYIRFFLVIIFFITLIPQY